MKRLNVRSAFGIEIEQWFLSFEGASGTLYSCGGSTVVLFNLFGRRWWVFCMNQAHACHEQEQTEWANVMKKVFHGRTLVVSKDRHESGELEPAGSQGSSTS
jgi:hypothetical protein